MGTTGTTSESTTNDQLTFFPRPTLPDRPAEGDTDRDSEGDGGRAGSRLLLGGAVITLLSLAGGSVATGTPPDSMATSDQTPTRLSVASTLRQPACRREAVVLRRLPAVSRRNAADHRTDTMAKERSTGVSPRKAFAGMGARHQLHDPTFWTLDVGPPQRATEAAPRRRDLACGGEGRTVAAASS